MRKKDLDRFRYAARAGAVAVSILMLAFSAFLFVIAVSWAGVTGYKFMTYKESVECVMIDTYSPVASVSSLKWPVLSYKVGDKTYTYMARFDAMKLPESESLRLNVHYRQGFPGDPVTSLDFYDSLVYSAVLLVSAFLLFRISRILWPHQTVPEDEDCEADEPEPTAAARPSYTEDATDASDEGRFESTGDGLVYYIGTNSYASGWMSIGGSWYYFDPESRCVACRNVWKKIDNDFFFFNEDGTLCTGWKSSQEHWFYLNKTPDNGRFGRLLTGWVMLEKSGAFCYLNEYDSSMPSGAMFRDMIGPGGYYLDGNGKYFPDNGLVPQDYAVLCGEY